MTKNLSLIVAGALTFAIGFFGSTLWLHYAFGADIRFPSIVHSNQMEGDMKHMLKQHGLVEGNIVTGASYRIETIDVKAYGSVAVVTIKSRRVDD